MIFFFFFSSRRRHTRSLCDWSSDVCSSDLGRRCRGGFTHSLRLNFQRPSRGATAYCLLPPERGRAFFEEGAGAFAHVLGGEEAREEPPFSPSHRQGVAVCCQRAAGTSKS